MKEINGNLTAKGLKIALVASRFNSFLVEQLVKGAADAFARLGGDDKNLTLVRVPGAYEIPVTAKRLAATKAYDAVVGLGAVVQGATPHASLITETTARAFTEIACRWRTAWWPQRTWSRRWSAAARSRATRDSRPCRRRSSSRTC